MPQEMSETELETLRLRAEARLHQLSDGEILAEDLTATDLRRLMYELRVHQTELEMQNEELRHVSLELEEVRDRYADLYDFAPVGYLTLDRRKCILEANFACAELLRTEKSLLHGQLFTRFVLWEDRDILFSHFRRMRTERARQGCELRLAIGNDEPIDVHLETAAGWNGGSKPLWYRMVVMDISERKRIEKALQDADRCKDEFLAMLGHELRNPLAPIRNAAELLGLLDLAEPKVKWIQEVISRQVSHLSRLVNDLLDVSRIVQNKITLKRESLELGAICREAIETVKVPMDAKRQRLELTLPKPWLRVEGDFVRLVQVLVNLLDNASKYSPTDGVIALEAGQMGGSIQLQVRDQGIGIPPTLLPHIFEIFQQGERTLDRSQGGLGLGLTLVRRLVELHGGHITAHSGGVGQGSTLTVHLPLFAGSSEDARILAVPQAIRRALRILLVEDELDVADSTRMLLQTLGNEVRISDCGEDAIRQAQEWHPELVLLDIGLQGMDGYQVAVALRQLPSGSTTCLTALTGYDDTTARRRSREIGFEHYLVKPVARVDLESLIASVGGQETG